MLTSEGQRRADIEVLNIGLAQKRDLLLDMTQRHDFIGAGRDGGRRHGHPRHPDQPDVCMFITGGPGTKQCAGGKGEREGHVLRDTTSRAPGCMDESAPRTSERGGQGATVVSQEEGEGGGGPPPREQEEGVVARALSLSHTNPPKYEIMRILSAALPQVS